jgi:hypothetical protein
MASGTRSGNANSTANPNKSIEEVIPETIPEIPSPTVDELLKQHSNLADYVNRIRADCRDKISHHLNLQTQETRRRQVWQDAYDSRGRTPIRPNEFSWENRSRSFDPAPGHQRPVSQSQARERRESPSPREDSTTLESENPTPLSGSQHTRQFREQKTVPPMKHQFRSLNAP